MSSTSIFQRSTVRPAVAMARAMKSCAVASCPRSDGRRVRSAVKVDLVVEAVIDGLGDLPGQIGIGHFLVLSASGNGDASRRTQGCRGLRPARWSCCHGRLWWSSWTMRAWAFSDQPGNGTLACEPRADEGCARAMVRAATVGYCCGCCATNCRISRCLVNSPPGIMTLKPIEKAGRRLTVDLLYHVARRAGLFPCCSRRRPWRHRNLDRASRVVRRRCSGTDPSEDRPFAAPQAAGRRRSPRHGRR